MNIFDAPKDSIRTNSGLYINIFEPTPEMICIEDIAHALASVPRFGGHMNRHYSVAQHSTIGTMFTNDEEDAKTFLLHDATEAYMMDIPTPIKNKLPDYKFYEDKLMEAIATKFGVSYPFNAKIKEIDNKMLILEWDNLVMQDNLSFICFDQKAAKKNFLSKFNELFK
jgi:hypothetical protein